MGIDTCTQCDTELPRDSRFCPRCGTPAPGVDTVELLASSASDPTGLLDRLRAATEGEFQILRELGHGGMGRVYLAQELALDRRVALKVLPPAFTEHTPIVQRFQREARTAGKLSHPHIVPVYQVSERGGLFFFTMPYVAGSSLRQVLRKTPQLKVDLARRYLREAADALGYAHTQGVIHRDVKPENMLLEGSRDGRLLLTDFGIAKALGVGTTLTRPGDMMGTPYFMSPEQCEESESIDGRSDQYSLGLVGYEMLAGRFPFSADSMAGIVYKHLHEYPEPLRKVRPDLPDDLVEVIERAIRKDPKERFPTMHEMLEALGGAESRPTPVAAAQAAPAEAARPRRAGGRRWALAGALVLVLTSAGASAVWWQQRQAGSGSGDTQLAELGGAARDPDLSPAGALLVPDSIAAVGDTAGSGEPAADLEGAPEGGAASREPDSEATAETGARAEPLVDRADEERRQALIVARADALGAREQARTARSDALKAHADSIFPDEFQRASGELRGAEADLRNERFVPAALGFGRAAGHFESLARQASRRLEAARLAALEGERGETAAGDSAPPDRPVEGRPDEAGAEEAAGEEAEPPAELPPDLAIESLLEVYRQAVEAEDAARIRDQVYAGSIPKRNAEYLDYLFRQADELEVALDMQGPLAVAGDEAEARVRQRMTYRLRRTGERRDHTLELRMYFQRSADGWRLVRFED